MHSVFSCLPNDIHRIIAGYLTPDSFVVLKHVCNAVVLSGEYKANIDVCAEAAAADHFEVLKWAKSAGYPMTAAPWTAAANGNIAMIEWILADNTDPPEQKTLREIGIYAAKYGRINVLEWIATEHPGMGTHFEMDDWAHIAAEHDHLDVIKWCRERGYSLISTVLGSAISGGNLEICKWLHEKGVNLHYVSLQHSIITTTVEVVEWMNSHGYKWPTDICTTVAHHGRLDLLKLFHGAGYELPTWRLHLCFGNGNLEIIRYLHENGIVLDNNHAMYDAIYGHIHVLEWWIENIGPINRHVFNWVAASGSLDTLKWVCTHGHTPDNDTFMRAFRRVDREKLDWLREQGCVVPTDELTMNVCVNDYENAEEMLDYLLSIGYNFDGDENLYDIATSHGNIEVVEWLRKHRIPGYYAVRSKIRAKYPRGIDDLDK